MIIQIDRQALAGELIYQTSRSGGKGGQHVNKVSSKVEVGFSLQDSQLFSEDEKGRLLNKIGARLTKEGLLKTTCEEDRSQLKNKQRAVEKMALLLEHGLRVDKVRKATKPSKASKEKRLTDKLYQSMKKINRRNNE